MDTVLLYILGVLVVAVGIAVSIALHELGHFVPAKRFGVKVSQFMVGFGPTVFSRRRGETEYGLKAIPLGGYISMAGMLPPAGPGGRARTASTGFFQTLVQDARTASADTITAGEEQRTFYLLPVWKRVVIMLGGPVMNLLIGVVLYAIVLCGFGIAQQTTTIANVSECVLPASSERQICEPGDTAAPGAAAGLLPGDRLVEVNGTEITSWDQATEFIRNSPDTALEVIVARDGDEVVLTATPILTERYLVDESGRVVTDANGESVTEEVGFLGVLPIVENARQPLSAIPPAVGDNIARVALLIVNLPQRLIDVANAAFGPGERDPEGPLSPVGVGRLAGEVASLDTLPVVDRIATLVNLLASLNIALFVFNLVPLLPLDGGHVAGALWEGLRRRFAKLFKRRDPGPVDTAKLIPLTLTVVLLLGAMSALLIYADIVNPVQLF